MPINYDLDRKKFEKNYFTQEFYNPLKKKRFFFFYLIAFCIFKIALVLWF